MYALATGGPPSKGNAQNYANWLRDREPTAPRKRNPGISTELETIIQMAMARPVDARYQSALDVAEDLRRFLEHRPLKARPPSYWNHFRLALWRNRFLSGAIVATLLVCLTAFSASVYHLYRVSLEGELRYSNLVGRLFENLNDQGWINKSSDARTQYLRFRLITEALDSRIDSGTATQQERFRAAQMHYFAAVQLAYLREQLPEARDRLRRSIRLFKALAREKHEPLHQLDALRSQDFLAICLENNQDIQASLQEVESVYKKIEKLCQDYPNDLRFAEARISFLNRLATMHVRVNQLDRARSEFLQAREMALAIPYEDRTKQHTRPWYFYAVNACRAECGLAEIEARLKKPAAARDLIHSVINRYDQIIVASRLAKEDTTGYETGRLEAHARLPELLVDLGQDPEALAETERYQSEAIEYENEHPSTRFPVSTGVELRLLAAQLYLKQGLPERARHTLLEAQIWSEQLPLYQVLLWIESPLDEFCNSSKAVELLENDLITQAPEYALVQVLYAQALVQQRRFAEALDQIKTRCQPLVKDPKMLDYRVTVDLCQVLALVGTGQATDALKTWNQVEPMFNQLRPAQRFKLQTLMDQARNTVMETAPHEPATQL